MVSRPSAAQPHSHHLDLVAEVVGDIQRNLDRLGRMRGLTVVRLAAGGGYGISHVPAERVRTGFLADFGVALPEAINVIDDVLDYDADGEVAVLVVETNPVDGALMTFMVQSLAAMR